MQTRATYSESIAAEVRAEVARQRKTVQGLAQVLNVTQSTASRRFAGDVRGRGRADRHHRGRPGDRRPAGMGRGQRDRDPRDPGAGRAVSTRQYDGSPSGAATVSVTWSEAAPPGAQVREIVATTVGAQPSVQVREITVHTDAPPQVPGTARIWTGHQWAAAVPQVWLDGQWIPTRPYVWTGDQSQPLG